MICARAGFVSALVQYPFVARSVLAVHKATSRLRDEERRSPFLGAHGSYGRYLEHVPPQLNQGDSRGAEDGRGYRH